jgi:ABC-type lipoprotein export system ATPase subunit
MIKEIKIISGFDKNGNRENVSEISLKAGETISIVGPTGSGKTALITDIELLAQGDTNTKRRILIDGEIPLDEIRFNPANKPIAMITQNTKCFVDLSVKNFLLIHAQAKGIKNQQLIFDTINLANKFTGEKIAQDYKVTTLSGGQTRSLLIADAILIGASPIILLDEIENAGIFKQEVIQLIQGTGKMIIFVTHDPVIALSTQKRIIMKNGSMHKLLQGNESEIYSVKILNELDNRMGVIREKLRVGEIITKKNIVDLNLAYGGIDL